MLSNNIDFKRSICQQFDPTTDYSNASEPEIDGTFEATVLQLLLERTEFQEKELPKVDDAVTWKYGDGTAIGRVKKVYARSVTLKLKDSSITRNGTKENPALEIVQDNGSRVLKLASEVKVTEVVDYSEIEFRAIIHRVIKWNGLDIGLEYQPGDIRFKGTGYERKLRCGYGHIRKYIGADGEALDCYLAPSFFDGGEPSSNIYQVSQLSLDDGDFDEHKFMVGFDTLESARQAYLKEMTPQHFGGIEEVNIGDLEQYKKQLKYSEIPQVIEEALTKFKSEVVELTEKIQIVGEVLTLEEYDRIATVDDEDIKAALLNWKKVAPDAYNNLLDAEILK